MKVGNMMWLLKRFQQSLRVWYHMIHLSHTTEHCKQTVLPRFFCAVNNHPIPNWTGNMESDQLGKFRQCIPACDNATDAVNTFFAATKLQIIIEHCTGKTFSSKTHFACSVVVFVETMVYENFRAFTTSSAKKTKRRRTS